MEATSDDRRRRNPRSADPSDLGPLPGGHHGLSREQIVDSQRERLLAAMVTRVAADGYRDTKIAEVVKAASVSTRDFYELFDDKEDCFLAAFEVVREHLEGLIERAVEGEEDWPHRVIAALRAALGFFAAEQELARFCLHEAASATPAIAIRFREAVLVGAPPLAAGRAEMADPDALLPGTEDAILGGIVSSMTRSVVAGETERMTDLIPGLLDFALSPYLGAGRAGAYAGESEAANRTEA